MNLSRSLSIGLHVPTFGPDRLPQAAEYTAFFRRAEALGFDAVWAEDRILHEVPILDPLLLLTWAASCTERMLLGTAIMVLNIRRAMVVARQVATLHHLSGQRFALGVSIGGHPAEYAGAGVSMSKRVGVLRDALTVVRGLNSGAPFTYQTTTDDLPRATYENAIVRPAAPVPLLMGGIAEPATVRAGELADGWIMAPFGSLEDFARGWQLARDGAEAAGRDPAQLVAGRLIYVCANPQTDKAREELQVFLRCYYGDLLDVDRDGIFGTAQDVADQLKAQIAAGITHLMLGVPNLKLEHLEYLANAIIPQLRELSAGEPSGATVEIPPS